MANILAWNKNKKVETVKLTTIDEITNYVQQYISDHPRTEEWLEITRDAQARVPGAREKSMELVTQIISDPAVEIPGIEAVEMHYQDSFDRIPFKLNLFKKPDNVPDRRKYVRVPSLIPVVINKNLDGTILNISVDGVFLQINHGTFEQGEEILLELELEGAKREVKGLVVRKEGRDKFGVKFLEVGKGDQEKIALHIFKKAIAYEVYKKLWGLSSLEEIYTDPEIDEIRVNTYREVYIQRRGKNEKTDIKLQGDDEVISLINRLHIRDRVMATSSTPYVESILKDGSRLTATLPPLTPQGPLFVLRKHGTFAITKENYIERGTMNSLLHDILALLAKGQSNILIIGPGDTGKSTLVRYLIGFFRKKLRILLLESDAEIRAREYYPDRDIVEFEEQRDLGLDMKNIFPLILRFSPDMVILGEIRRPEELIEAINACIRGHSGAMATVHYRTLEQAFYFLGTMLVTSGLSMTIPQSQAMVAKAFNIGVVLYSDTTVGIKKVERVTEIITEGNEIKFNDLAVWKVTGETYFEGEWVFPNKPSDEHIETMMKYGVTRSELEAVGWM